MDRLAITDRLAGQSLAVVLGPAVSTNRAGCAGRSALPLFVIRQVYFLELAVNDRSLARRARIIVSRRIRPDMHVGLVGEMAARHPAQNVSHRRNEQRKTNGVGDETGVRSSAPPINMHKPSKTSVTGTFPAAIFSCARASVDKP